MLVASIFFLFITIQASKNNIIVNNVHRTKLKNVKFDSFINKECGNEGTIHKLNNTDAENRNLNIKVNRKNILLRRARDVYTKSEGKKDVPVGFLSPRDEMVYKGKYRQNVLLDRALEDEVRERNVSKMYFDFESILERNLARSFPANQQNPLDPRVEDPEAPNVGNVEKFEENMFFLKSMASVILNWTSCDDFGKKALFHPDDIINLNWLPFYVWSVHGPKVAVIHKFTYPTKKLVQQYKANFEYYIENVNWNQPKLLMSNDEEMLLIAGDRKGLFHGIPSVEIPLSVKASNIKLSAVKIRLKIVDPYLAIMYCDERYAALMAILGEEPAAAADKEKAAAILKFSGSGKPVFRDLVTETQKRETIEKKLQEEAQRKVVRVQINHVNADSLVSMP